MVKQQLTAPGSTSTYKMAGRNNVTAQYTVAAIDTTVVVRLEGTQDGTNYFNLDENGDTTITANGTYGFKVANISLNDVKFTFVSETGGTAATIDVVIMGNDY